MTLFVSNDYPISQIMACVQEPGTDSARVLRIFGEGSDIVQLLRMTFSKGIFPSIVDQYRASLMPVEIALLGISLGWSLEHIPEVQHPRGDLVTTSASQWHPWNPLLFSLGRMHNIKSSHTTEFLDSFMFLDAYLENACSQIQFALTDPNTRGVLPLLYNWLSDPDVLHTLFPLQHINACLSIPERTSGVHRTLLKQWFSFIGLMSHPALDSTRVQQWYDIVRHRDMSWAWFIDSIREYAHSTYGAGNDWQIHTSFFCWK